VYRTHAIATGNGVVSRAVIVIHGLDRDADAYFNTMVLALRTAGVLDSSVVVAPHFQTLEDGPLADEPYWSSEGWKRGDLSDAASPLTRTSSFAVVDSLIRALSDRNRFPRLKSIVLTGHSAGAQFTHRYAAAGPGTDGLGVVIRFVVANPSSYLWLRSERPVGAGFAVPDSMACPGWDDWPYGLRNRNTYAKTPDDATVRSRLTTRDVRVLVGDADTLTANLDMSCEGNLQGARRYDRGRSLVRFMGLYYPGNGHRESVVPGVGHSSAGMYGSAAGQAALTSW
jgi:pimeloyl-ACP methyl ester carboxylesterase